VLVFRDDKHHFLVQPTECDAIFQRNHNILLCSTSCRGGMIKIKVTGPKTPAARRGIVRRFLSAHHVFSR
jgi:hypothetical protein